MTDKTTPVIVKGRSEGIKIEQGDQEMQQSQASAATRPGQNPPKGRMPLFGR